MTIKTTDDSVTVTAKREHRHEDGSSEGHSIEQTSRIVRLPKDVSPESVKAYISSDGDLKLVGHRNKAISGCKGSCKRTDPTNVCKSSNSKALKNLSPDALSDAEKPKDQQPTDMTPSEELPGLVTSEMETTETTEPMETDVKEPTEESNSEVVRVEDSAP